jgi:hypothetical protein
VIKAEIEADIAALLRVAAEAYVSETECQAAGRAVSRLREMLSKLDGPAEGYGRVWIRVRDYYGDGDLDSVLYQHKPAADDECGAAVTLALVVADIPLRQVPVIEGVIAREGSR